MSRVKKFNEISYGEVFVNLNEVSHRLSKARKFMKGFYYSKPFRKGVVDFAIDLQDGEVIEIDYREEAVSSNKIHNSGPFLVLSGNAARTLSGTI